MATPGGTRSPLQPPCRRSPVNVARVVASVTGSSYSTHHASSPVPYLSI
ncbi:hypothetical protein HMPREF9597_01421 [Cutibacterium acnes HL005PA4]|nr:hypothetical protein HMPREF9597_01421 [Cutibacterium acnes HL005PA4]